MEKAYEESKVFMVFSSPATTPPLEKSPAWLPTYLLSIHFLKSSRRVVLLL